MGYKHEVVAPGEMTRMGILDLLLDLEWGECVRIIAPTKRITSVASLFHYGSYKVAQQPEHKDKRFHVYGFEGTTWVIRVR